MMKQSMNSALLACAMISPLATAEPVVHTNFDLSYDMGVFLADFPWFAEVAPLDISLSAAEQAPKDFIGSIPENCISLYFRASQASGDIGWNGIGGELSLDTNVSIVSGNMYTVHSQSEPDTTLEFLAPAELQAGDIVGPDQDSVLKVFTAASPTDEAGFDDYWFMPKRIIVGVIIAEDDGMHYGFAEFEDVSSIDTSDREYYAVRWGYESEPNTPYVIPQDCGSADTDRSNSLNFLDVSMFLSAYADRRFTADMNNDNQLNFLDVSEFLAEFSEGCP